MPRHSPAAPPLSPPRRPLAPGWIVLVAILAFAHGSAAALDLSLPELGDPAARVLSSQEEARIGQQMMREIRREVALVDDPAINAYVRDLGTRIATATDMPGAAYRFFVVDDPRINAFAMPGGYVGVHSGLITASRNESELGAVIAHELAHVTQRHIARRVAATQGVNLRTTALVLAGLLIGSQNPQAGMAAATSGMASGIDSQLAYSRDHEREADRVGMRILARADLNPQGMPDFFQVLMDDSRYRSQPPAFLSTHPLTEARIADARAIARSIAPSEIFESPDHAFIRARARVLSAENPDEAVEAFAARVQSQPDRGNRYGLAYARIRAGDVDRARRLLDTLASEQPEHALLVLARAEAAMADNAPEAALAELNRGLSLFPDHPALTLTRVEVHLQSGRPDKALAITRTLSHQQPNAPEVWSLHARAASAAGDDDESALAMAQYYAVQGDTQAGLSQLKRLDPATATPNQMARARALRERWESRIAPDG
ncbi:M48 family metalloprotease [Spiribacter pallidus]|uniref:M48 family metalloprotease n=1 Tax=Spiribacter pallidus TaxID=1987936 RepID=UPI0034A093BD